MRQIGFVFLVSIVVAFIVGGSFAVVATATQITNAPQIGMPAAIQLDNNQDGVADIQFPAQLAYDAGAGNWGVVYWVVDPVSGIAAMVGGLGPLVTTITAPGVRLLR